MSVNIKSGREMLETKIQEVIARNVQGVTFNETGNKMIAMNVSKEAKKLIKKEEKLCNSIIGTIIFESDIEYKDYLTHASGESLELLQVKYKNEEFNIIVIVFLIPLNCNLFILNAVSYTHLTLPTICSV
eukprot:TRINITY_DN17444_c0_g1_i1.p1 TRINITY_DN17444_c0_g1~~TRINITY_DN17444_c0_g1_i1.p1  ORF type:complete len:130 (-),score=28.58 TRINITY_DN17444_c0_g1_i1:41-430(-)